MADDNRYITDFYVYSTFHEAVANGGVDSQNIRIQADSDFQLQKLTYFADKNQATQTDSSRVVPLATVLITDSGSGRNIMSEDIAIPALFGIGELPFILPTPKIFPAQSIITLKVTNFSSGDTYDIRLNFIGRKLFRK